MGTFEVQATVTEGWAAVFVPSWDDYDNIIDVDGVVVQIAPDTVRVIGTRPCVSIGDEEWVDIDDLIGEGEVVVTFDDTHDLRPRLFRLREDAEHHATWTEARWNNPALRDSFILV